MANNERNEIQTAKRGRIDVPLLVITILLLAFGLLMLFSASFYYAQSIKGDGYYYVFSQLKGIGLGTIAMIALAMIDYRVWKKYYKYFYFASVLMLILVLIPGIGVLKNEARRWIDIKIIEFQPSEIAKFSLIMTIAAMVENYGPERMRNFLKGILPILMLTGLICILIYFEPNFSVLACIAISCFFMLICSGTSWVQMGLLTGAGLGVGSVLMLAQSYRVQRVNVFRDPWAYAKEGGYQLVQSLYAIGNGGLFGRGLGASRQKFLFLPYRESDFIFAIIAEEWGFVGGVILLGAFFFVIIRGYRIALRCPDTFGSLMAAGVTTIFALQVAINVAVVTSSMPPTGLPLPFISAGSTSIAVFMGAIGLLLSISRSCPSGSLFQNKERVLKAV